MMRSIPPRLRTPVRFAVMADRRSRGQAPEPAVRTAGVQPGGLGAAFMPISENRDPLI